MDEELKNTIKEVLKDPKKRHKLEKALLEAGANRARKRAHEVAEKLNDKVQENWPEVKEHVQNFIDDLPEKAQKAKDGVVKAAEFTGRTVRNLIEWAMKNNKNKALVLAALLTFGGTTVYLTTEQSRAIKKAQKEEKIRLKNLEDKLTQKRQITDAASFANLFDESLPLIQAAFLTSEVYVPNPYTDNGSVINTIGAGSWWYPKNGDPTSSEWIHTRDYVKSHPYLIVDGNQAMALVKGWFCSREDGRIYKLLCNKLQGQNLSINEFVAICGVVYNSEKAGLQLLNNISRNGNCDRPLEIAKCMMNLKYDKEFENGLLRRNAAQSVSIVLGNSEHCALHAKKIGKNYVTSISVLPLELCQKYKDALNDGDSVLVKKLAEQIDFKMSHWLCRNDSNGHSALRQVQKEVKDTAVCNPICRFAGDTLNVTGDSPYWGDVLYDQAREYSDCGMYDKAAQCYEDLFAKGFYGADLYLDAARNYYEMGDYSKCCNLCKKVYNNKDESYQNKPAYQLAYNAYKQNNEPGLAKACKQKLDSLTAPKKQKAKYR